MLAVFRAYVSILFFFFFNDTATTEIYTLSLHDALPISSGVDSTQRSSGVIASHRCAAGFSSRSAWSRCAHVCASALYQRRPWRRAIRVATVVLPELGGPPIQRTCLKDSTDDRAYAVYRCVRGRRPPPAPPPLVSAGRRPGSARAAASACRPG